MKKETNKTERAMLFVEYVVQDPRNGYRVHDVKSPHNMTEGPLVHQPANIHETERQDC